MTDKGRSRRTAPKLRMVSLDRLVPYEGNPRIEGKEQVERIQLSLEGYGFVEPVIAFEDEKLPGGMLMVVVGHQRLKAAAAHGEKAVPTIVYPFRNKRHAVGYNIASNRLAEMSSWDIPKLKENIEYLDTGELDLELTGFSEPEIVKFITWTKNKGGKEEEPGTANKCPKCGYEW